jgi:hypothetical protein
MGMIDQSALHLLLSQSNLKHRSKLLSAHGWNEIG